MAHVNGPPGYGLLGQRNPLRKKEGRARLYARR